MNVKRAPLLVAAVVLTLVSSARAGGQAPTVTRPAVSENASPAQTISPVAQDGFRGQGILRKPPGDGPFPAVVVIHPGLETWPSELLRQYVSRGGLPSRFLEAGYVVATVTYRSRDVDPQTRISIDDSVAAVRYLQKLPYVNAASVVVFGCSGGGDLALAVAAEQQVAAIAAEEPASILFTGVFDSSLPKAGGRYTPQDSAPIFKDPKQYYTDERRRLTQQKIARIQSPILVVQGDVKTPLAVNDFNATVLIPELRSARKTVQVMTYPDQPHCFAFGRPDATEASEAAGAKAFQDIDSFFRRYIATQPRAIDATHVTRVPLTTVK